MNQPLLDPVEALSRRFAQSATVALPPLEKSDTQVRIGFRIGGTSLLLPPGTLTEVMSPIPTYRLPNTPAWCLGLINVRGNLLPLFEIHKLIRENPAKRPQLLILGSGAEAAGILIDNLPFSVDLPPTGTVTGRPGSHSLLESHLGEYWRHEGEILMEIDHLSLLHRLVQLMET